MITVFNNRDSLYALKRVLSGFGIESRVVSTPVRIGKACGISLAIRSVDYVQSMKIANKYNIKIAAIYMKKEGDRKGDFVKVQNLQK